MKTYPTGENARSLIEFQSERIHSMEDRIAMLEKENEILRQIIQSNLNNKANEEDNTLRQVEARVSGLDY